MPVENMHIYKGVLACLMSHLTKSVLRVLLGRLQGRTSGEVAEEQRGFMPDKETRNAVFTMRIVTKRAIEMQKDVA